VGKHTGHGGTNKQAQDKCVEERRRAGSSDLKEKSAGKLGGRIQLVSSGNDWAAGADGDAGLVDRQMSGASRTTPRHRPYGAASSLACRHDAYCGRALAHAALAVRAVERLSCFCSVESAAGSLPRAKRNSSCSEAGRKRGVLIILPASSTDLGHPFERGRPCDIAT